MTVLSIMLELIFLLVFTKLFNWKDLNNDAHNLKGVSANYGAKQLSFLAARLEENSQQQKLKLSRKSHFTSKAIQFFLIALRFSAKNLGVINVPNKN